MSNPTISQIKVGSTTYDIHDAVNKEYVDSIIRVYRHSDLPITSPYANVKDGRVTGALPNMFFDAEQNFYTSEEFYFTTFYRITMLNVTFKAARVIDLGSTPALPNPNISDFILATIKPEFRFLWPSQVTPIATRNMISAGWIADVTGQIRISDSFTRQYPADHELQVRSTYINQDVIDSHMFDI